MSDFHKSFSKCMHNLLPKFNEMNNIVSNYGHSIKMRL